MDTEESTPLTATASSTKEEEEQELEAVAVAVAVEATEEEATEEDTNNMEDTAKIEAVEAMATALHVAQIETEALAATAASIATASALPAVDPALPTTRDVKLGDESHPGTMLLLDLILLNKVLLQQLPRLPTSSKETYEASDPEVQNLATKLTTLILQGKQYELSGLKDVPRPFLVGKGRIFDQQDGVFVELSEEAARERLVETIVARFKAIPAKDVVDKTILEAFDQQFRSKDAATTAAATTTEEGEGESKEDNGETAAAKAATDTTDDATLFSVAAPRPCDILFLPTNMSSSDSVPFDQETGNKHLLYLASQSVVVDTKEAAMRVQIALKLLTSKMENLTNDDNDDDDDNNNNDDDDESDCEPKQPRYILQQVDDSSNTTTWKKLEAVELAEFATIFVFEVYLEKQIHHGTAASVSGSADTYKASKVPLEQPTVHDVLFGRGGMTNGHPGNRRFRDIIALHRPDYIRATKMDKPKVARRIVRAIRLGTPPGRFLKKADDGKWYDVGDRCAAEKTSQGLRERSNTEKRQRSAMREALRIRREDVDEDGAPVSKKAKTGEDSDIPLSLSMKEKKTKAAKKVPVEGDASTEDLPPNAVDKEGNILVTDHDILCGRGGLTNHHKGNKRFRDIVALHRPDYVRAPKIQKPSVARVIVRAIRNGDPPGRFLRKDKKTGFWIDIGDKRAAEKTSQALREKTKEEQAKAPGLSPFVEEALVQVGDVPPPVRPMPAAEKAEGEAANETKTEEGKEKNDEAEASMVEI